MRETPYPPPRPLPNTRPLIGSTAQDFGPVHRSGCREYRRRWNDTQGKKMFEAKDHMRAATRVATGGLPKALPLPMSLLHGERPGRDIRQSAGTRQSRH